MEDNLIYYGTTVKVLGDGRVGGYLVRYSNENDPDLEEDFFKPITDYGVASVDGAKIPVYYHHGLDETFDAKRMAFGTVNHDEVGIWLETQLNLRDEYEKRIYEMIELDKMGYSSQAAPTLVRREPVGKSWFIKSWPIAEASLTPTPAEPRNAVVSVKSLLQNTDDSNVTKTEVDTEFESTTTEVITELDHKEGNKTMTDEVKKDVKQEIDIQSIIDQAVKAAVTEIRASEPEVKAGVQVIEDEADKALKGNPFKPAEFFKAVYNHEVYGDTDKRLKPLKAAGANEAIPSQGGFLVTSDIASGIHENMWGVGRVLSLFSPINVKGNGLTMTAIDETSRANGSRMGGIQGYWMAEGAEKTSSKAKLRQVELKLKKVAALCYATDELLEDSGAFGQWIANSVPNELRFLVEDSFIDGDGIGKPLGILQGGSLISATRTDASQVDADDVGRMWSHRYLGSQDYVWFVNATVLPQLYRMSLGDAGYVGVYTPPGGLSQTPYGSLMGRPVVETEYNPYLGTVGDILLASPSQYLSITKGGVQSASSIHVRFIYDESAFRFVYRVDGESMWASSVTAFDGTHTVSPFVALAATT